MNKVFLIGNLTRDPELRETPSGVPMCRFAIAVSRPYSSQDGERQTDFFECTAWRGLAETIARFTKKGNKVAVVGHIQIRNYEDNQGVKRTVVDVIVQDCEFLTPKNNGDSFDDVSEEPRMSAPKKKPTLQAMDDDDDTPF
ncbi:MAG: single-stranded DNA-binding protein [Clostridia bacterium]|nr:single-stranded DNA-binding protein [Clostridia bacterium]